MLQTIKNYLNLHMVKNERNSILLDNCGIGISILCSIHCALTPLLIISTALAGSQMQILERLEMPLFLTAAIIGSVSVIQVYLKTKRPLALYFLFAGLFMIIAGGFIKPESLEPIARISGSIFIIFAHLVNKRKYKSAVR